VVVLRPGRRIAKLKQTGTDFRNIGRADAEPGRHLHKRQIRAGKHPVPQILTIGLSTTPPHRYLRPKPDLSNHRYSPFRKTSRDSSQNDCGLIGNVRARPFPSACQRSHDLGGVGRYDWPTFSTTFASH
jgi:hypothetical protein